MKVFIAIALFWALPASATIIDNGGYTTVNGLDWLDLTTTVNTSVTDALSANPSYSQASKTQFQAMISEFYSITPAYIAGVTDGFTITDLGTYAFATAVNWDFQSNLFTSLFGLTYYFDNYQHDDYGSYGYYDDHGIQRLGGIKVYDNDSTVKLDYASIFYNRDTVNSSAPSRSVGQFLVRTATIPEPSVFALMGLGLLGFGVTSRKQKIS